MADRRRLVLGVKMMDHGGLLWLGLWAWGLVAGIGATGCTPSPDGAARPPAWVGSGASVTDRGERLVAHGVGVARGIRNAPLARTTADNRARASLARALDDHFAKTSSVVLRGVEIEARWVDPTDGTVFSLARLVVPAGAY